MMFRFDAVLGLVASSLPLASSWNLRPNLQHVAVSPSSLFTSTALFMTATEPRKEVLHSEASSILEDRDGHINRDLAERIWAWEQLRREAQNLPKVQYSIRSGLRLVDRLVNELAQGNERVRSDLIQDGIAALLDSMSVFRRQRIEDVPFSDFESFAKRRIRKALKEALSQDAGQPIPVPEEVRYAVTEAKRIFLDRRNRGGPSVSWSNVADELSIPLDTLKAYLRLGSKSSSVSLESTVEIANPLLEDRISYRDQQEWESTSGMLLDGGKTVRSDEVVQEYIDFHEGDDEAWVQETQVAGLLSDVIPDKTQPSADDLVLKELIRTDVSNFLEQALDPVEIRIIRLTFGLDSGQPQRLRHTADQLNMETHEVDRVLRASIDKLRDSYKARFVDDEDYEGRFTFTEDSI